MNYIGVPYQIHFEDTMAYGSHHYLTNFRFQCIARERFFFSRLFDAGAFKDIVILTQQGYSRNMAPVGLGERVGILLTFDEPTRSTVRLCFRVVRYDGTPVCCGYQMLVFTSKNDGGLIPIPRSLVDYVMQHIGLIERLNAPPFAERVVQGGKLLKTVFTNEVCELGKWITEKRTREFDVEIVNESLVKAGITSDAEFYSVVKNKIAFMFPGQGSYDHQTLLNLYQNYPHKRSYFVKADVVTRQYLHTPFLPLVEDVFHNQPQLLLQHHPDLEQVAIFLIEVILAELLIEQGLQPDILVGHSFGELAALSVGGAFNNIETGFEIICQRILALNQLNQLVGGMLAVSCSSEKLSELAQIIQATSLTVAIVNHPQQIILSGLRAELEQIETELARQGISSKYLKSRYPFHSDLLLPAMGHFRASLKQISFQAPKIPVYSPIEQAFYTANVDFSLIIASHFIRPFNFGSAVKALCEGGCQSFIECGAGNVLVKLTQKNLSSDSPVHAWGVVPSDKDISQGLKQILQIHSRQVSHSPSQVAVKAVISSAPKDESLTLSNSDAHRAEAEPTKKTLYQTTQSITNIPIAIVSMGCLLPEAENPEQYWENILAGVNGIIDLGIDDPLLVSDFKCSKPVVPDKTYTLLSGKVPGVTYDESLPYSLEEFASLTRGQKLLAKALAQCLSPIQQQISATKKVRCLLGSTADGIKEYDEALFAASLQYFVEELDEPKELRSKFSNALTEVLGYQHKDYESLDPYASYKDVVERFIGQEVQTLLLDAACASSLYSVDVAIKLLQTYDSDLVLSGGVFAPGIAMNCLFAQFNGLSATGSRPFDATADGVVFSEGAAMLALKRLPDAIAAGNHIHGVIRGVGTSSDGKSTSVNVPTTVGQTLACQRACENAGVEPSTIQYIEAHATATSVGDATEFKSLKAVYGERPASLPKIYLGSVKALIGHTGWAAGTASIIKICKAFEAQTIPPQHCYQLPNKEIDLESTPFVIPVVAQPWSVNIADNPRRAAVNGFGFGGTNANVIIEEYVQSYHQQFCQSPCPTQAIKRVPLALVGISTLFPGENEIQELPTLNGGVQRFKREHLHLPVQRRLLPDVTEQMDSSQYLSVMTTEKALRVLGEKRYGIQNRIGLVLGMAGKTGRGIAANERLYLEQLKRRLQQKSRDCSMLDVDFERMRHKLFAIIQQASLPSTPYTLIGLMPNVTAGQVCNLFNFNGPNIVVDADTSSLVEALRVAELMLIGNDCDLVLAGSINTCADWDLLPSGVVADEAIGEAACMLALTTVKTAEDKGFRILSTLDFNCFEAAATRIEEAGSIVSLNFGGATGAAEIAQVVEQVSQDSRATFSVCWRQPNSNSQATITFAPYHSFGSETQPSSKTQQTSAPADAQWASTVVTAPQQAPIDFHTPKLFSELIKLTDAPRSLKERRILFLSDQQDWWATQTVVQMLEQLNYTIACPAETPIPGAIPIDLSSEETIKASFQFLDRNSYDTIVAIKDLATVGHEALIAIDGSEKLLNLLFAVTRYFYGQLQTGKAVITTLCLNAWQVDPIHPYTGLVAGFMKSIARELPTSLCKSLSTDASSIAAAFSELEMEINGQVGQPFEVCYRKGDRQIFKLVHLPKITQDQSPYLNCKSIVLATGGGRGVTAVLMEEVLRRFGCTVVLLGRTDLTSVPSEVLLLDEPEFAEYEKKFYQVELARDRSQKMPALKRQIEYYQAARELQLTLKSLAALPGKIEYISVNVTNSESVNKLVQQVVKTHGRVDFVVHGAGIQVSKLLPKRTYEEFQRIINTKLAGLKNLYHACQKFVPGRQVHFHILSSSFSYIGNDGQPDYGAANEFMNRLAAYMDASGSGGAHWSTLAWLGWAGIGMTRGSEYAVLSQKRGLRGIQAQEGQDLFFRLLNGRATAPINILLTEGEKDFYQVPVVSNPSSSSQFFSNSRPTREAETPKTHRQQWSLNVQNAPYLLDHLVNGIPTMPATFEQELIVQAAQALKTDRQVVAIENSSFSRFIKFFNHKEVVLTAEATIIAEDLLDTLVHVRLLSDFVHKNGVVLQKDCVHCEMNVRLTSAPKPIIGRYLTWNGFEGKSIQEAYMELDSPVSLRGVFQCLNEIVIGTDRRRACFRLQNPGNLGLVANFATPAVLIDAMLRVATSNGDVNNPKAVFVPQGWAKLSITPNLNDRQLHELHGELYLIGSNSWMKGDELFCDWLQVMDVNGTVLALMEQASGLSRRS